MFEWFADFWQWLQDAFWFLIDIINPAGWLQGAVIWALELLPTANPDIQDSVGQTVAAVRSAADFIGVLDYFVNLPFLVMILLVMVSFEGSLALLRAWRVIRSLVT